MAGAPGAGDGLDPALAQRVVDAVAPTLRRDLNLMDIDGTVVASTRADRVGQPHRAAREVVATGRPVLVTDVAEGVEDRPGANVPLELDDRIAGVVGVTGDPAEVEPVARVVALTVGLLLAREREHDSGTETRTRVRALVAVLASPTATPLAVQERLEALGLGRGPWSVGVWCDVEVARDGTAVPPPRAEQAVTAANDRRDADGAEGASPCAVVVDGLLWGVAGHGRRLDRELGGTATRRVVVEDLVDLEDLAGWAHDLQALGRRGRLLPTAAEEPGWRAEVAVGVAHLPDRSRRRLARTAARLSPVHRNTLLQRVDRIRALTGLDLGRPDEAAVLLGAVHALASLPDDL
ncbi:sugar diacid recognition domain-containing protein [Nocardioides zeae]|uniref:Sugar diacid recognition family protein n=1 Tax=Nocardioides zeae TaxID=1457234 RepID=A0A6P0HSY3_9ACTN|nr:sugar diacid recognition domain-containing protein [Nocardioides zeae]NEN80255.1 sugar diacid recognition family protein [Nocardioides zeae]